MINLKEKKLSSIRKESGDVKQAVVALIMEVQEPAISKLEKKSVKDTSVDKLMRFVEAIGGELDLSIKLPNGDVLKLNDIE